MRTLGMGAGVQTTAILLKYWERYDYVIFADTGDEMPETYAYIEKYLKPFCKEKGLEWVTVRHKDNITLRDYSLKRQINPIRARRWCTEHWKVKPIRRFIRSKGATKKNPCWHTIGFSMDEWHRARTNAPDPLYMRREFPLLDDKIYRSDCLKIIEKHGWELPIKSGCYYCPFYKRSAMKKLYKNHPDLFDKAVEMEMNASDYPKNPMFGTPLVTIRQSQSLDQWSEENDEEGTCDEGYCMT